MLDQNDRDAVAADLAQHVDHCSGLGGIEAGAGLVGQEKIGARGDGACDLEMTQLAHGQAAGGLLGEMGDGCDLHAAPGRGLHVARPGLAEQRADADVLEDAEVAERLGDLEGARDAQLRDLVGGETGDPAILEAHCARGGRQVAGDQVEQRRFPRAVGADDAGDRARLDGERDVGDGSQAAEVLRQLVKLLR